MAQRLQWLWPGAEGGGAGRGRLAVLTDLLREGWELVDVLAGVLAVGDAEAELEVERLEEPLAEVMPLNHAKVVNGSVAHGELNPVAKE